MAEAPDKDRESAEPRGLAAAMIMSEVEAWFVREVLPLEAALMHFLLRSRRSESEADDLRQEVYVRVYEAAKVKIPHPAKPFVFAIARNLLVDRVRHEQVVAIEMVADVDTLGVAVDEPGPDRSVIARQELRLLETAIERLPRRCRQVVILSRIEGLSRREIAQRMGIGEATVSTHLTEGMYALAKLLYGEPHGGKS
jgi:RNA polymerase sigma-70 factor (ECF subfamily)